MNCEQRLKSLTVLFVEDEHNLSHLLQDAIGDRFRHFALAQDGEEGLSRTLQMRPDLVITDITMPKMNGLEMSDEIHKHFPQMPIIILSAYSEKEHLLQAIDVGVIKYLIKPFDPDELLEAICSLATRIQTIKHVSLLEPYTFDLSAKRLFKRGILVPLTQRENLFIDRLLAAPNRFMTTEEIKEAVWGDPQAADERLRVFINRLRQKTDPDLIKNIVGQGYMLPVFPDDARPHEEP
jgi:DNA-binding response OmpR family regulator